MSGQSNGRGGCLSVVLIAVVGGVVFFGPDEEDRRPVVAQVRTPELTGVPLPAARVTYDTAEHEAIVRAAHEQTRWDSVHEELIERADRGWVEAMDATPLSRRPPSHEEDWMVIGTAPAAGEQVPSDADVYLFVLREEEAQWFANHPTMPVLAEGVEAGSLVEDGGPLAAVAELTEFRYAAEHTPQHAPASYRRDREPIPYQDPFVEPETEWAARSALAGASEFDLTAGSLPTGTEPVRLGRVLTVVVRSEEPELPSLGGSEGSIGGDADVYVDDDDDDFNVPGWLCPTRFC